MAFLLGAAATVALFLGSIISTSLLIKERAALRSAEAARQEAEAAHAKETQLRREAESHEAVRKARLLMAQNQYEQADEVLGLIRLEKPSVESQALLRTLGDWNAINSRWPRAIERFVVLVQLNPPDDPGVTLDHFRLGTALVEAGQRDDYERFRQETVFALWQCQQRRQYPARPSH
jgi:hypothetical protein